MRGPSSPRGLLSWAASVTASHHRAYSPRIEYTGWTDRRMNDSRESAISIIMLLEKSANGNGGASLVLEYFTEDRCWHSYLPHEQRILSVTIRRFKKALQDAGFLPREEKETSP